jgi:1,4-alpha-glucan branching enzyme
MKRPAVPGSIRRIEVKPRKPLPIVADDPWLTDVEPVLRARQVRLRETLEYIRKADGSLKSHALLHTRLGLHRDNSRRGWWYREWAPGAQQLWLVGDFNQWNPDEIPLVRLAGGYWEVLVRDRDFPALQHGTRFKVRVLDAQGRIFDRLPAFTRWTGQDPETHDYAALVWHPKEAFQWTDGEFSVPAHTEGIAPFIYETHPGMATEDERVGTWREFAETALPRVKALGYNAVQLMAVQEHPYYGSFGYHVSNFFAPSSRFGTPDDLRYLVDRAHSLGLLVIMDVVHSHAVKNYNEGLNDFDGTGHQYFHSGARGEHAGWDSKLFDYGRWEVRQFLLSNLRYWLDEFHFDGFRFDGVTSMLYHHHGEGRTFGVQRDYFGPDTDDEVIGYLQLAAQLVHQVRPGALCIAEDMSGHPGLCRPLDEGGIGFDYRLAMGLPDHWIKLIKERRDEDWHPSELWHLLTNRRRGEKNIAYAESHDQALVGDQTLAFRLIGPAMYTEMDRANPHPLVERGVALHKLIRLLTAAAGGEGYLTFMGNEFGHPEWIVAQNGFLRYEHLENFDRAMVALLREHRALESGYAHLLHTDDPQQTLFFHRGGLVFAFNFHPTASYPAFDFAAPRPGKYRVVLSSDAPEFSGHGRVLADETDYFTAPNPKAASVGMLTAYLPSRTAIVFRLAD